MLVSIVVPCFNEEEVIKETAKRLINVTDKIKVRLRGLSKEDKFEDRKNPDNWDFELIFINDGSKDRTEEILKKLSEDFCVIKVINFSRNFGHQIAVTAGIDASQGDAVVLIDADLQDPPELIEKMIELWIKGFEVVYATRTKRQGENKFKLTTARIFYRVLNLLSDTPIPLDTGDFRLMDRSVVNVLKNMPERDRFIRGMVSWVGFNQISLPYERKERFAGKSKYPLRKMMAFAISGIMSFSIKPLRLSIWLGFISSIMAFLFCIYAIVLKLFTSQTIEGWTSIVIAIMFMGGVQLICLGVLGEYIGRIYEKSKDRPLYIVKNSFGFQFKNKKTV